MGAQLPAVEGALWRGSHPLFVSAKPSVWRGAELVEANKIPSAHNWSFGATSASVLRGGGTSAALQKQPLNELF